MGIPPRSEAGPAKRILLIAGAAALLLVGCGSQEDQRAATSAGRAEPLGEETAGSVAQLAQCRDWNRGGRGEKLATIEDIRSQVNREDSGFEAPPLSDAEAMRLLDTACAAPYAQGFRLYILYARGASAAPLLRE
jgi:hypothetical protein